MPNKTFHVLVAQNNQTMCSFTEDEESYLRGLRERVEGGVHLFEAISSLQTKHLSLIALGFKNIMIAETLFVSKSTVKKTLENIFRDLNAKDRANAVAIAFAHNIINVELLTRIEDKYQLNKFL